MSHLRRRCGTATTPGCPHRPMPHPARPSRPQPVVFARCGCGAALPRRVGPQVGSRVGDRGVQAFDRAARPAALLAVVGKCCSGAPAQAHSLLDLTRPARACAVTEAQTWQRDASASTCALVVLLPPVPVPAQHLGLGRPLGLREMQRLNRRQLLRWIPGGTRLLPGHDGLPYRLGRRSALWQRRRRCTFALRPAGRGTPAHAKWQGPYCPAVAAEQYLRPDVVRLHRLQARGPTP